MKKVKHVEIPRSLDPIASVRASVSFPPDLYQTLVQLAKQNRVSLAWVVREAAEQYVAQKWPLLKGYK